MPACNEELLIERAIAALLVSADELDDPASLRLVVACDTCTDDTVRIADAMAAVDPRVEVIEGSWRNAGAARAAAIDRALQAVCALAPQTDVWVATTDADTLVPVDWLTTHAQSWERGDHAVAGVVDLLDADPTVQGEFDRHYAVGHDAHGHVHGANLGVRADAYTIVGGFPEIELAEDHALWRRLRDAGFTCRSSVALRVATSARLSSRAPGGFADMLSSMMAPALLDVVGESA
ncbi:unnamed protein product [Phaeothamnion confervicola]